MSEANEVQECCLKAECKTDECILVIKETRRILRIMNNSLSNGGGEKLKKLLNKEE